MIEFHKHNGIDAPRIYPGDLLGFPQFQAAPTHKAEENTQVFTNFGGFVGLWVMMNRVWNLLAIGPAFTPTGALSIPGPVTINNTTPVTGFLSSVAALNFGAIAVNASADLTMTLTGAAVGDSVFIGVDDAIISTGVNCANIVFFAWVSAVNTVKIRCTNNDPVLVANPANGNFRATIIKF